MNRKLFAGLATSAALLLCWGVARAQQNPEAAPPPADIFFIAMEQGPGADFGPMAGPEKMEMLGFAGMHPGKVVTGAPFSATATSESVQTLADGSHITRKTTTNLFRDTQGRFRKETTAQGFGPLTAGSQSRTFILLHDAVAGSVFALDPDKKVARQLPNPHDHGARAEGAIKDHMRIRKFPGSDNVQTDDLGTQSINGISAQGTRHTRTIPAGEIGNEKPISIVVETWYSPDLQLLVMSKRSDPRFGETTYSLSNILRKEPDASLFSVPAGYTIEQAGPGQGLRRHAHPGPGAPAGAPAEPPPPSGN